MGKSRQMESNTLTGNTLFYSGSSVSSSRVLYTPSPFARSSLLWLQECGNLIALKPHVSGRDHLSSYLFFVVKSGEGWLEYNGERYELKAGDAVFIDCRKGYSQSSSESLWTLSWVHFNSGNMPAIYNKYCERGGRPTFHPENPSPYTTLLDSLYTTASSESHIRDVKINTLLSQLVGLLFAETVYEEGAEHDRQEMVTAEKIDISQIKSYIDTRYQEPLNLAYLADYFHFNKNYVSRVFKETFGMSVGSYIQIVRVGRAKELLRFTSLTVEQISNECGYGGDSNYLVLRESWVELREKNGVNVRKSKKRREN